MADQALVEKVAAAIRFKESTNNYSLGANGDDCWGAYQFQEGTWVNTCKQQGNDASDRSPANQDKVAKTYIAAILDENNGDVSAVAHTWAGPAAPLSSNIWSNPTTGEHETVGEYIEKINTLVNNGTPSTGGNYGTPDVSSKTSISDPKGILSFAGFAASLAFQEALKAGFESAAEDTLHGFLTNFMSRFYHNMYYIPTLPSNKCIIVKPELLFVDAPSCNVIYPSFRTSGNFNRTPRSEPTRIIMVSDPVSKLFGGSTGSDINNIITIAYIDYADDTKTTLTVKGFKQLTGDLKDLAKPMGIVSEYEKDNGIRILKSSKGADIYLFLLADVKGSNSTSKTKVIKSGAGRTEAVAEVMFQLASYTLQRSRYELRPGSYSMYFNPYIIPGFPVINLETESKSSLNVHAYCTDVVHQIDQNGWTTSVQTTASHVFPDPKPNNFPIIEDEYVTQIDDTYDNMLGPAVKRIKYADAISSTAARYSATSGQATEAYKMVWRPLTTLSEHLTVVCDGATPTVDENGILIFKGAFFNSAVQSKLVSYTTDIMAGTAFSAVDIS